MKKIATAQIILTIFAGMFLFFSEAQAQYNLMQPIKGLGTGQTVSSYVPTIIMLGIALAALLAVVVIVVAGFMYITAAGNPGNVEKAKSYLLNAIIGLLIAIGYWLILQAINPDILKGELGALESAPAGQATATGGGGATEPVGGGGGANPEGETLIYESGDAPEWNPDTNFDTADLDFLDYTEEEYDLGVKLDTSLWNVEEEEI